MLCRQKWKMAMARIESGDDPRVVAEHFNVKPEYLLQSIKKPVEPAKKKVVKKKRK